MKFNININASAKKVWQVLFNDSTYREWTKPFHPGSYAEGTWEEGSRIKFLGPDGSGLYGEIVTNKPNEYMAVRHIGEMRNFEELPLDEKSSQWTGNMETYRLKPSGEGTELEIELTGDETDESADMLAAFKPAMEIVKRLSENPIPITVETHVDKPIDMVWKQWTSPDDIKNWNSASPDWHSPRAENDLRTGGSFNYRMEAKDGSFGFDFEGKYTDVEDQKSIKYEMADGRKVDIGFTPKDGGVTITQTFDAEEENSLELQRGGWQAIMDNFKKYSES